MAAQMAAQRAGVMHWCLAFEADAGYSMDE
jgi:hypothetical protein